MALPALRVVSASGTADASGRAGALPAVLRGRRRVIFARLLLNGLSQAAAAVALPFTIMASSDLPMVQAASLLGLLALVLVALRIFELVDAERLGLDYVAEVRLALFDSLARGGGRSSHGVAMTRLMNDLSALKNWVGLGLARSVVAAFAFSGCVVAAATLSVHYALVILAPALLVGVIAAFHVRPLTRRVADVRQVRGRLANQLGEALLSLGMLRRFGQTGRSRRRVATASRRLTDALGRRMRVAATLRALPELTLPFVVIAAIALQLPFSSGSIGLILLAGLAVSPLRQALRAVEYRATYVVARERLAAGIAPSPGRRTGKRPALVSDTPGLEVLRGPVDDVWRDISSSAMPVSSTISILPRSLRRNIDVARRHRGDDAILEEIAGFCGLLDPALAPDGLATRLTPDDPSLTENIRSRLSLARALAYGATDLVMNVPSLLIAPDGRALLRQLPEQFEVRARLVAGDIDFR